MGDVVISPAFEKAFPHMVRKSMYFGVRCVGYDESRQLTLALMLAVWNQERSGQPGGAPTTLTAPELHSGMRTMIVKNWLRDRQRTEGRGALYAAVAPKLDLTPEEFRVVMIDEQEQLLAFLADQETVDQPGLRSETERAFDPDVEQLTDFLTDALPEEDDILVQHRLMNDPDFFEKAWPLLRAWQLRLTDAAFDDSDRQRIEAWAQRVGAHFDGHVPGTEQGRWRRAYFLSDTEMQALWKEFQELAPVTPTPEQLEELSDDED